MAERGGATHTCCQRPFLNVYDPMRVERGSEGNPIISLTRRILVYLFLFVL